MGQETREEWKIVAWSDKSSFLVNHIDGRVLIHQFPNETLAPRCTVGKRQTGDGGYYVGNVFMKHIRTHILHRTIPDIGVLCLLVVDQVHPFMTTAAGDDVYQQDYAPCRGKGRTVREWFEEHSSDFQVMPPNSLDQQSICGLTWKTKFVLPR
ncbi:hypothetical protein X975_25467, partial [Stegodyphus mimosarum]